MVAAGCAAVASASVDMLQALARKTVSGSDILLFNVGVKGIDQHAYVGMSDRIG